MILDEYQIEADKTAIYPKKGKNIFYPALGLCSEAGEVADKIKKIMRDKMGIFEEEDIDAIEKEIGDVLWYTSMLASEFGISLEHVAQTNLKKLQERKEKNTIHGDGDNR
jgi:NTP pyrophosphatase (non-canonical NTP hydrolase)